ncbi:hypothetical protein SASPL_114151 [Salvia splendens]|uniref:GH16 domain-containing protein n=1 Tax=Salvia splendens TaxID=180675 RepID=A0A8X9A0F4_SALSN|nr:hypothetical protein SASPL_114151 [Salvia splendens]
MGAAFCESAILVVSILFGAVVLSSGSGTAMRRSGGGSCRHKEQDLEFLGNSSGEPYTVHTNVFAGGKGDKEQQFDPTSEINGAIELNVQIYGGQHSDQSVQQNAGDESLLQLVERQRLGGRVKADWSKAPFLAAYRDFNIINSARRW